MSEIVPSVVSALILESQPAALLQGGPKLCTPEEAKAFLGILIHPLTSAQREVIEGILHGLEGAAREAKRREVHATLGIPVGSPQSHNEQVLDLLDLLRGEIKGENGVHRTMNRTPSHIAREQEQAILNLYRGVGEFTATDAAEKLAIKLSMARTRLNGMVADGRAEVVQAGAPGSNRIRAITTYRVLPDEDAQANIAAKRAEIKAKRVGTPARQIVESAGTTPAEPAAVSVIDMEAVAS